ncbi:MAG: hypothetical protein KKE30_17365, partial [Gammaproteobacteria bacterium]|nr:hypothetical protein [Gammaproteobacteria bacterium]
SVQLQAISDSQNVFVGWQGACSGISSCTLIINSGTSVISVSADFAQVTPQAKLTLKTGVGGSITSELFGSACVGSCDYNYPLGTVLTLQAQPEPDYVFKSWEGVCSGTANCQITLQKDTLVGAIFVRKTNNIQLQILGNGEVTSPLLASACRNACDLVVPSGQSAMLSATADNGYEFDRWSNECGENPICALVSNSSQTITATFKEQVIQTQAENYIVLTNPGNQELLNYPLQFGRPFLAGEISQYPQLVLNGATLLTQADVKQRHADGSVKHAILSAVVPKIEAGASLKFYFNNQETGRNSLKLSKAQMLESRFNFNATIKATFTTTGVNLVSARAMLEQDKFSYWLEGDVATTVLIVDHSVDRPFDFGSDEHRSVRPAFYATFWPGLDKVQIRFVGEVTNTEAIQDQSYDLTLTVGQNNPQQKYQRSALPHQAMTRWTKQYWLGDAPAAMSLDHHLPYLISTRSIPNFSLSIKIPESAILQEYSRWNVLKKDLYEPGRWLPRMATTGGRSDIGIYPSWTVLWLYTGDRRLAEISYTQSELSGAWPMHVREGDSTRTFDLEKKVSGLGRILSINQGGRPTAWIPRLNWHEVLEHDKIIPVSPLGATEWRPDNPHHPDYASPQYLLSGDYYFLEQMLFLGAYTTMDNNAAGKKSTLGRGPTGSEGALYSNEVRAQGWNLRTRVHLLNILPDNRVEKVYFDTLTKNAIALWDGMYDVQNSSFAETELFSFGRQVIGNVAFILNTGTPSPLGQWVYGVERAFDYDDGQVDYSKTASFNIPWMSNIMLLALGRAEELGYPTRPLLNSLARTITGPISEGGFEPELLASFSQPATSREGKKWFTNWSQVRDGFLPEYIDSTIIRYSPDKYLDADFGYNMILFAASSFITHIPEGKFVHQLYSDRILNRAELLSNPKWAIVPRQN